MTADIINQMGRKYPFIDMKIDDNSILNNIEGRSACIKCGKSRKFYCYSCYVPVHELYGHLPKIKLPVKIDIIKHKNEIDGKSTAAHAPILAPDDARIFTYPDIPDYSKEENVVLVFPSSNSITVASLFNQTINVAIKDLKQEKGYNMGTLLKFRLKEIKISNEQMNEQDNYNLVNLPISRAVFIDSTWNQSKGIFKDERVKSMKTVLLQNRASQFWRHQRGSPRWYLATIEAIHQFLLEVHITAWSLNAEYRGLDNLEICDDFFRSIKLTSASESNDHMTAPYNGQYDNLLFFFSHMYDLIHIYYDHNELKSYKRPI